MNSSLFYLLEHLREDFDLPEEVNEENTTSNLDGGLGQPQTPFAFRKDEKDPDDDSYSEPVHETDILFKKFESNYKKMSAKIAALNEVNYKDFKADDSKTERQKINSNVLEISKKLREVEQMINHARKLKTESGADQNVFWKGTLSSFLQIKERLNRLSNKITEMNS